MPQLAVNQIHKITTELSKIRRGLTANQLIELTKRRDLIQRFQQSRDNLQQITAQLNRVVKVGDKNIPTELRKISASCNSVMQALQDRACKRKEAITLARSINNQLRSARELFGLLDASPAINLPIPIITATSYHGKKRNVVLNDLKDLDQYQEFINLMKKQVSDFNEGNKSKKSGESTPPPLDDKLNIHDNANVNKRGEAESLRIEAVLLKAWENFPKIELKKNQTYQRVRVPLLVVPHYYISPNILKQARMEATQLYMAEELPAGLKRGIKNEPSPLLINNQWVMVLPLPIVMDKDNFNLALEYNLAAISDHLGKMVPMPIAASITTAGPAAPTKGEFRNAQVDEYMQLMKDKSTDLPLDLRNFMPSSLKKLLDSLTPEKLARVSPTKLLAKKKLIWDALPKDKQLKFLQEQKSKNITHSHQQQEYLTHKIKKQQDKKISMIDQDRRRFFTNKRFKGLAFVWLVTAEQYQEIHRIPFRMVNFPDVPKSVNDISQQRSQELAELRHALQGDLIKKIEILEKEIVQAKDNLIKLKQDQDKQNKILKDISDKKSIAYRTANAALEMTNNKIAILQGKLPALKNRIQFTQKEISKRIEAAKIARNK